MSTSNNVRFDNVKTPMAQGMHGRCTIFRITELVLVDPHVIRSSNLGRLLPIRVGTITISMYFARRIDSTAISPFESADLAF